MGSPLFVLGFLQVVALLIYFWVGRVFISQPVTNHPGIFYDPTARFVLCYGPAVTMVISVVLAFVLTNSPWLFLGFSLAGWVVCSPRPGSKTRSIPQQNLYDVIELPQDAGRGLIEEQCIRLGERYRLEKNSGDLRAALLFAQVEKAYETLVDPAKRAAYDAALRSKATAPGRAAFIGTVSASANSAAAVTGVASGDISLHSKINSWVALLLLLAVAKVLSDVLSRIAASWLQANNFGGMTVATVGAIAGVVAAFVIAIMMGWLLAWFMPIWPPLAGVLMTRGAKEITSGSRIVVTVALLVLVPVALVAGEFAVKNLQRKEAARIAEDARSFAEKTRRAAEVDARIAEDQAREQQARIAEMDARMAAGQAPAQQARNSEEGARIQETQARIAEAQARIVEAQARAAEDRAAASARAEAQKQARIESIRQYCGGASSARAHNYPPGSLAATVGAAYGAQMNMKLCSGYDTYYQTPSRQR